jgi:hypothetical protein
MIILTVVQPPVAVEPVTVNFDTVLEPGSERLASVTWTVSPGITLGSGPYGPALSNDRRKSTAWFTGGSSGQAYLANAHYISDSVPAREDDVQVLIQVT